MASPPGDTVSSASVVVWKEGGSRTVAVALVHYTMPAAHVAGNHRQVVAWACCFQWTHDSVAIRQAAMVLKPGSCCAPRETYGMGHGSYSGRETPATEVAETKDEKLKAWN